MQIYPAHAYFLFSLPIVYAVLLLSASALRTALPSLSCGYLTLVLWAWIILSSWVSETFNISPIGWLAVVFLPLLLAIVLVLKNFGGFRQWFTVTPLGEIFSYYLSWIVGMLVLSIPLLLYLPPDTIISGRHVCNDVVGHALLAKGADHYAKSGLDTRLFNWYPRGFHIVFQYVTSLIGVSPVRLILPFLLFCYSFIVTVTWDAAKAFGIRTPLLLIGLAAIVCSPFLNLAVVYLEFAAQATVIPLLLGIVFRIFVPNEITFRRALLFQLTLACAAISVYTVFPITIIGLAVLVRLLSVRPIAPRIRFFIREILTPRTLLGVFGVVLITLPAILAMLRFFSLQLAGDSVASDILRSSGNLKGYLSPFHFAGFWSPAVDFRIRPEAAATWQDYAQFSVILLFLFVLYRNVVGREFKWMLLTFLLPVVAIPLSGATEYVHFKYLSVMLPVVFLAVGTALAKEAVRPLASRKLLFAAMVIFSVGCGSTYSGRIIGKWPTFSKTEFNQYLKYRHSFLLQDDVIVLTQDDYFRYVSDRKRIYLPLLGVLQSAYHGEQVKRIVLDRVFGLSNGQFLDAYPDIKKATQNPECREYLDERIEVYRLPCS